MIRRPSRHFGESQLQRHCDELGKSQWCARAFLCYFADEFISPKWRETHKTGASSPVRGPFFLHGPPTRGSLSARKSAIIEAEEWRGDLRSMGIAPDHREGRLPAWCAHPTPRNILPCPGKRILPHMPCPFPTFPL